MSGGHWNYSGFRIQDELHTIAEDPDVQERFPALSTLLLALGDAIYKIEKEIDWDLSSDSHIPDDPAFEAQALWAILEPAMKAAPDAFFPRGKWATIQAVQGRQERQPEQSA